MSTARNKTEGPPLSPFFSPELHGSPVLGNYYTVCVERRLSDSTSDDTSYNRTVEGDRGVYNRVDYDDSNTTTNSQCENAAENNMDSEIIKKIIERVPAHARDLFFKVIETHKIGDVHPETVSKQTHSTQTTEQYVREVADVEEIAILEEKTSDSPNPTEEVMSSYDNESNSASEAFSPSKSNESSKVRDKYFRYLAAHGIGNGSKKQFNHDKPNVTNTSVEEIRNESNNVTSVDAIQEEIRILESDNIEDPQHLHLGNSPEIIHEVGHVRDIFFRDLTAHEKTMDLLKKLTEDIYTKDYFTSIEDQDDRRNINEVHGGDITNIFEDSVRSLINPDQENHGDDRVHSNKSPTDCDINESNIDQYHDIKKKGKNNERSNINNTSQFNNDDENVNKSLGDDERENFSLNVNPAVPTTPLPTSRKRNVVTEEVPRKKKKNHFIIAKMCTCKLHRCEENNAN